MLTVIAIIGILAGILIPTTMMVMKKARIAAAKADIKSLEQALNAYNLDFGAYPPDRPFDGFGNPIAPFPAGAGGWGLNPNQCMVWFLSRTYSTGSMSQGVVGQPAGYPSNPNGDWTPSAAGTVFARGSYGPYFMPKAKQTKDIAGDGYPEFVDPWGRPYLYHAYYPPVGTPGVPAAVQPAGVPAFPSNATAVPQPLTLTLTLTNASAMGRTAGSIQLGGFTGSAAFCNGTFAFQGVGANLVTVTFSEPVGDAGSSGATGYYCFPLHNPQSCDIYSLGPNGTTQAAQVPSSPAGEWHPVDATSLGYWVQVWSTPGAGNDVESATANVLTNVNDRDDVNNW